MGAVEFWEERYASRPQVWSGRVNPVLVDVASELPPHRALDLGCGEGGDALWLARQGWQVTAVDISTIAIGRGRAAAQQAGLGDQLTWVATDLGEWTPDATYDLVSAFFLQSPVHLPRAEVLRRAATAVAPGGHLLVVSHAAPPPWATQLHADHHDFPTPAGDLAALELASDEWDTVIAEVRSRPATGPAGERATLDDTVVLVRRLRGLDRLDHTTRAAGMDELVALYDADGNPCGSAPRSQMRAENLRHAATAVVVRDPAGRIYVHRRTQTKDVYPGRRDFAAGGVIAAGEDPDEAAVRELAEELGVTGVSLTDLGRGYYADDRTAYHGFCYAATWDGPIRWQPEEVADGEWLSPQDLAAAIASDPDDFMPDTVGLLGDWLAGVAGRPV